MPLRVYSATFESDNVSDERHAVHIMILTVAAMNAALQGMSLLAASGALALTIRALVAIRAAVDGIALLLN